MLSLEGGIGEGPKTETLKELYAKFYAALKKASLLLQSQKISLHPGIFSDPIDDAVKEVLLVWEQIKKIRETNK